MQSTPACMCMLAAHSRWPQQGSSATCMLI
jgi:hypothetical protein